MEHDFTCVDDAGERHKYTCTQHRGSEGLPLTLKLSSMVVEPMSAALGPVAAAAVASGGLASLKDFDLETLDFDRIAGTLRNVLASMPMGLIYACLRYTNRDGLPLVADGDVPTKHFDDAYARNYLEIGRTLWNVCEHNCFFPGLATLASEGRKALAAAQEQRESDD